MPSDAIAVREADPTDVPALVDIYRRAYGENARRGFPSSMTAVRAETIETWLQRRTVFVATDGGAVVGVVQLIPRSEWEVPELGRLAVAPTHQRRGIGTRLLAYGEAHARDAGWTRLRLRALSGHPFLEDWYRRHGYERVGVESLAERPYDAPILETKL